MQNDQIKIREATITYKRLSPAIPAAVVDSRAAVECVVKVLDRHALNEHFVVVGLDCRNRPLAWGVIGIGGVSICPIDVGAVLRFGVLAGASAIILAHNHPSGEPDPSTEDVLITQRIVQAAKLIGLRVLDHVILGDRQHFSFVDAGIISTGGDA